MVKGWDHAPEDGDFMSSDEIAYSPAEASRTGELLLELLSEEIPARMQRRAIEDLQRSIGEWLVVHRISEGTAVEGYVTPRRLVIIARRIPEKIPGRPDERRGPRVGAPAQALEGFLRANLLRIEQCEIRDTDRGQFYFAVIQRPDQATKDVLPEIINSALLGLQWPKSMRWPRASLRWVRPLTSILCVYRREVLPVAIDGVAVGRTSRGHRFLSPGKFCADSAAEYLEKLQHAYVILDQDRRRELISADLDRRAAELGVVAKPDPGLLDEVTGLAEFPLVLAGAIDPGFMTLPPEVLQTAMRTHQKYFSCTDPDGSPAPHFLFVADNLPEDGGAAVVAGNERVLRARLADARFFWDQDLKMRLEDRVKALKDRVYHAKLGSVYDKVERMERLAAFLTENTRFPAQSLVTPAQAGVQGDRSDPALDSRLRGNDDQKNELRTYAVRAAHLAKADLSTGMVGEFPELQGVMGRYHAQHDREDDCVADAIAEHYKPLGPNDICPSKRLSVITALADKIDTLVSFFAIGERPSGSRDPFALRRAALGVIRLILENQLRLPLLETFRQAYWLPPEHQLPGPRGTPLVLASDATARELLTFFEERLKAHLRDQGIRHDLIAAVFALAEDDLIRLIARVNALAKFLDTDDGTNLLIAYRRAANIVAIEEQRDHRRYDDRVDERLFRLEEERTLSQRLTGVSDRLRTELPQEFFESAVIALSQLRQPVDEFFDRVTVNTEEPDLRENRLRLLARIRDTMNRVADFSKIEG
jgi:glycyl-tRNA synthetase beta chain